jgi:hypothetical protein
VLRNACQIGSIGGFRWKQASIPELIRTLMEAEDDGGTPKDREYLDISPATFRMLILFHTAVRENQILCCDAGRGSKPSAL